MKTIRLYHPHTHEGIAYDPPPEGIELSVNDADAELLEAWGLTTPPPALTDAATASDADMPVEGASPPPTGTAPAPRPDRRARATADPTSTDPAVDTSARSV